MFYTIRYKGAWWFVACVVMLIITAFGILLQSDHNANLKRVEPCIARELREHLDRTLSVAEFSCWEQDNRGELDNLGRNKISIHENSLRTLKE